MRMAFTTTFNAEDVHNWSGTPYHMSKALAQTDINIEYIGSLQRKLPPFFKIKQTYKKIICDQRESPRFNLVAAKHYSQQVMRQLQKIEVDVVLSPLINPIAYLDVKQPLVLWTDAVYASLIGFYPPFAYHSAETIQQGNEMTSECLSRCKLAIFSSEWAAMNALQLYGASRDKVKVVPFGANITLYPSWHEIRELVKKRAHHHINLLFLAKSWERKGGDIVLAVAKALHEAGQAVTLHIVGYTPKEADSFPDYVKCLGFISKETAQGLRQIRDLLCTSHFLFVPSRAEAYGIVFCEANAFALPCLTTYVGGIGTVVKDHVNGMTFALDAPVVAYCDYIVNLMQDRAAYEALALSSYHEFDTRLNWRVATRQVRGLIEAVL